MEKSNFRTFLLSLSLTLVFVFGLFAFCEVLVKSEKAKSGHETVSVGAYIDSKNNLNVYSFGKRRIIESKTIKKGIDAVKKYQLALPDYIKIPLCFYDTLQNYKTP